MRTGATAGEELLLRMLDDGGEPIAPSAFLPTAERFGMMGELDHWVVERAVQLSAADGGRLSVNLSGQSMGDDSITRCIAEAVASAHNPGELVFEITETLAIANMKRARTFARRLHALGCRLALDDFGTGFGSLTYLKHLPADYLKIDMEFVRGLADNDANARVVRSIVSIAGAFGLKTVAEGVEDEATLQALRAYDVDYAQGFWLGPPKRIVQT